MGPKERRNSVLSPMEEAAIVALRVQARLPLDDVYIALKDVIPHLTRSSLHRCLQRHGISQLPKVDREKPKKFKDCEIGYFHIDIAELRYEGGKGFLYVAVDRTSKLVFARIYRSAARKVSVRQWPWGTLARSRPPTGAQPRTVGDGLSVRMPVVRASSVGTRPHDAELLRRRRSHQILDEIVPPPPHHVERRVAVAVMRARKQDQVEILVRLHQRIDHQQRR